MKLEIRDITLISILSIVLFIQEEILNFIPNISLTIFLIVLYSKKLGVYKTSLIILIYCILDNLIMNSFNIYFTSTMLLAWLLIPIFLNTIFKKIDNKFKLALLGSLFSLIYCWSFIIPSVLIYKMDFVAYLIADIPFEIPLVISSFISILLFYDPCSRVFDKLLTN